MGMPAAAAAPSELLLFGQTVQCWGVEPPVRAVQEPQSELSNPKPSRARSPGRVHEQATRDELARLWKQVKRKAPPAEREQWLRSAEGIVALGAKRCRQILQQIDFERQTVREGVCGEAWLGAWEHEGQTYPPVSTELHGRRGWRGMVLSRAVTGLGDDQPGSMSHEVPRTRRWTPPQCVEMEDSLDGMTFAEAIHYDHPPSPSALAIIRIGAMRGREEGH